MANDTSFCARCGLSTAEFAADAELGCVLVDDGGSETVWAEHSWTWDGDPSTHGAAFAAAVLARGG